MSYIKHKESPYALCHHISWYFVFGNEDSVILGIHNSYGSKTVYAMHQGKHLTFTMDPYLFGGDTCANVRHVEIHQLT